MQAGASFGQLQCGCHFSLALGRLTLAPKTWKCTGPFWKTTFHLEGGKALNCWWEANPFYQQAGLADSPSVFAGTVGGTLRPLGDLGRPGFSSVVAGESGYGSHGFSLEIDTMQALFTSKTTIPLGKSQAVSFLVPRFARDA